MRLNMGTFNNNDIKLLKTAGIDADIDKEYSKDEMNSMCTQITEFILNHSSKNGDIARLRNEYDNLIRITNMKQGGDFYVKK